MGQGRGLGAPAWRRANSVLVIPFQWLPWAEGKYAVCPLGQAGRQGSCEEDSPKGEGDA